MCLFWQQCLIEISVNSICNFFCVHSAGTKPSEGTLCAVPCRSVSFLRPMWTSRRPLSPLYSCGHRLLLAHEAATNRLRSFKKITQTNCASLPHLSSRNFQQRVLVGLILVYLSVSALCSLIYYVLSLLFYLSLYLSLSISLSLADISSGLLVAHLRNTQANRKNAILRVAIHGGDPIQNAEPSAACGWEAAYRNDYDLLFDLTRLQIHITITNGCPLPLQSRGVLHTSNEANPRRYRWSTW